ncbi:MAG TPA: hypothetical protein VK828_08060 [Terriglobales bacterium]|jgi:hypothetical protein|nr:hypothetical protein [Terriglobales bacterium]
MVQAMLFRASLIGIILVLVAMAWSQSPTDVLTVKLDNVIGMEERRTKTNEMREFLWNHWIQRKPASLMLTAVSKEGKVTHSKYKITSLPGNSVLLKVTFVRDRIGAQGQVIPKPDGGYEAYTVERVESENPFGSGPEAKVTLLRSYAAVPSAKYWLRFKGWNDVLITYF